MHYSCTTFELQGESSIVTLPFPEHGGADYQLSKDLIKFNFWSGSWAVEDRGISDDSIQISGYDWDEDMSRATYQCHPCYTEGHKEKNCFPLCFAGEGICFDEMKPTYCFNPNICFNNPCGGICFQPTKGVLSGGCFDGTNCFPGEDKMFCFGVCNTAQVPTYRACEKIVYSEEFLNKFETLNTMMDNHEEFTITELGECINGVYIIQDFTYETVKGVPGLFAWSLNLKLVRKL
jgi:hypothetical protein